MKNLYITLLWLITASILSSSSACSTPETSELYETKCIDTNCENYNSWKEAQAAYLADPECRNDLDHDSDGIACEHLIDQGNDCPTTANCGCSGKSKAQCEQDRCCQWIVGEGCKCN